MEGEGNPDGFLICILRMTFFLHHECLGRERRFSLNVFWPLPKPPFQHEGGLPLSSFPLIAPAPVPVYFYEDERVV